MIAETTIIYKKNRLQNLEDAKINKKNHEMSLRMENNNKKIAASIKTEKNKKTQCQKEGETYLNPDEEVQLMAKKVNQTKLDIHGIKSQLKLDEKKFKEDCKELDKQLGIIKHENQVLNIKLKEKEQEVKLNDLKVKELKK